MSGTTRTAYIDRYLALVAEALQQPAFDAGELDKFKREWIDSLESERTDPEAIARRASDRVNNPYPPDDVRYQPTLDEELAEVRALTPESMRAFHKRFYGGEHAYIAIVGDFDADSVRSTLTRVFGDWRSGTPYTHVPRPMPPNKGSTQLIETPDKANAAVYGKLGVPITDQADDAAALLVAAHILGEGTESRLLSRIRVKDGLAYSVGLSLYEARTDANSDVTVYGTFAPQNQAGVARGFAEEFARAERDGFTDAEVQAAKAALLARRTQARTYDGALASLLTDQAWLDRTWRQDGEIDGRIAAVTPASATAAMRKHLTPDAIAWVYAGDFAGAKKTGQPAPPR